MTVVYLEEMMWVKALRSDEEGLIIKVEVTPGAEKDSWIGYDRWREALKLRIKAEPYRGRANEALAKFVAQTLGVSPGNVSIISGAKSRIKEVKVRSLTLDSASTLFKEVFRQ